mmetsp:Transcript_5360/g.12065  ORF Transcript_5360/g.12065 Transcript_5360/m.12065 type:complete len:229 (-) Transcript_5360:346-1032(-)
MKDDRSFALLFIARGKTCLHMRPERTKGARRDDTLRTSSSAYDHVNSTAVLRNCKRRGDVAIHDQLHTRSSSTNFVDDLFVARTLQNAHDDIFNCLLFGHRHRTDRLADWVVEVDVRRVHLFWYDKFFHVHNRSWVEHCALLRHGDDADSTGSTARRHSSAIDGVDGDVYLGRRPVTNHFSIVQHGRLILLSLSDYDRAFHFYVPQHRAHAVNRSLIRGYLVSPAVPL